MTIHELIKKSGFNRRTIYFYTQMELLPPPKGKGKNFEYSEEHVRRLEQIKKLQAMRYSLKEIRDILSRPDVSHKEIIPSISREKWPEVGENDRQRNEKAFSLWRRFPLGPDAELQIKWPPSEETLQFIENQFQTLIKKIKGELK